MASFSAFLNILVLLGALQGFIVSSLLFFSKKKLPANRILATLILLMSLACFKLYGANNDWFGSGWLRFLTELTPLVIVMPFGPLIYFYVQANANPNFKITKKQRRHFYPVVIDLVPSVTIILFIVGLLFHAIKNHPQPVGNFIDNYNVYADIPRWASITFYLWFTSRYLAKVKAGHMLANNQQPANTKWLQQMVRVFLVFQAIWLVYLVPYVIPKYSNKLLDAVDWYPLYIPLAAIIYWLSIKGYMAGQSTMQEVKKAPSPQLAVSASVVQQAIATLKRCMETDTLYLNPALNLEMVAQHTALPPKTISAVLNQHVNKSFNEFINEYRVNAFIHKMQQPGMDNLTIAGIAFECGFNSQATFQRTFKQVTGMSPTEYRKTALISH
jgi:AraC-like DNA-binding protein